MTTRQIYKLLADVLIFFHHFVGTDTILLKEKFVRCPIKMEDPELVLRQAHGQARLVADFLHENGNPCYMLSLNCWFLFHLQFLAM